MRFADEMLECAQCGTKFIFTVDEQRRIAEQGKQVEQPELCPVCRSEVQVESPPSDTSAGLSASTSARLSASLGGISFTERYYGRVKWFSQSKGYGFITQENGEDIFVHFTGIEGDEFTVLHEGQRVEFEIEDTPKGSQAIHVIPLTNG